MRVHGYLNFELALVCLENFIFHGLLKYSGSDIPFSDGIVWMFLDNTFCYIFVICADAEWCFLFD